MTRIKWLRADSSAWILGAALLSALSALAYWQVGWLGIGLVGLVGLIITTRIDLHGGHAVVDSGQGSSAVPMLAKQLEAQESNTSPEQRIAQAEERAKRGRILYVINTVLIGMIAFGFGLFVVHQLP